VKGRKRTRWKWSNDRKMPRRYSEPEKFKVEYLYGHPEYSEEMRGTLEVAEDYVNFKSTDGKPEFGFPIEKVKQVRIRETKRTSWSRGWMMGVFGYFFSEKHIQIIYEEDPYLLMVEFNFPEDMHDVRKKRFMELLPSSVKWR